MESPMKPSGWTGSGAPSTVERKRKGRSADVILPTPPRMQLPTPETNRRTAKRPAKADVGPSVPRQSQLPTPQTLVRHSRKTSVTQAIQDETTEVTTTSPSGHTTFFLSSSAASKERENGASVRRRPGLTFAQQMGLLPGSTNRRGVGLGMGGSRSGNHKKDQIRLQSAVVQEENPFLASGPGVSAVNDDNLTLSSPLHTSTENLTLQSPALVDSAGSIPTPPPTFHGHGQHVRTPPPAPASPTTVARQAAAERRARADAKRAEAKVEKERKAREAEQAKQERLRQMRDEDDNPFLAKPGESSTSRPRQPIVDETRPTVTYVFRGAKKVFANPFLGAEARTWESELDADDEEFEPHPCPPPKLLWPTGPEPAAQASSSSRRLDLADANTTPPRRTSARLPTTRPSPPSSPIPTPFGGVEEEHGLEGPADVFTPDDEFVPEGHLPGDMDASGELESEDLAIEPRRGLLFGQAGEVGQKKGTKRELVTQGGNVGKKPRSSGSKSSRAKR